MKIEVIKTSEETESDPRCWCRAQFKKTYTKPVLKMLDRQPQVFADMSKGYKQMQSLC